MLSNRAGKPMHCVFATESWGENGDDHEKIIVNGNDGTIAVSSYTIGPENILWMTSTRAFTSAETARTHDGPLCVDEWDIHTSKKTRTYNLGRQDGFTDFVLNAIPIKRRNHVLVSTHNEEGFYRHVLFALNRDKSILSWKAQQLLTIMAIFLLQHSALVLAPLLSMMTCHAPEWQQRNSLSAVCCPDATKYSTRLC